MEGYESRITIRFLIFSIIFALAGIASLKIRQDDFRCFFVFLVAILAAVRDNLSL